MVSGVQAEGSETIFCGAIGLRKPKRVAVLGRECKGNETHILRLQDKTSFRGFMEMRET